MYMYMCAVDLETWLGMYTYYRGFVFWLCFDVRSSETHHSYFVFLESRVITQANSCVFWDWNQRYGRTYPPFHKSMWKLAYVVGFIIFEVN